MNYGHTVIMSREDHPIYVPEYPSKESEIPISSIKLPLLTSAADT